MIDDAPPDGWLPGLADRDGQGVISTHFRNPRRPTARELQMMDWYGDRVADVLAAGPGGPAWR